MNELHLWLATARTLRTQHGYFIYCYATDDLNIMIHELTHQLSAEDGGQVVVNTSRGIVPGTKTAGCRR
eukprot:5270664-Pyramimonas_sp.AAC.1